MEEHEPDIALLDISMPVLNGLDAAQKITETKPAVKVILVTSYAEPAYVEEAFRRGARGYVLKGRIAELCEAIREVMQGQYYRPNLAVEQNCSSACHVNVGSSQSAGQPQAGRPHHSRGYLLIREYLALYRTLQWCSLARCTSRRPEAGASSSRRP